MNKQATEGKLENFRQLLERKGLKYTYERKTICEEVLHLKEHFDDE